MKTVNYVRIIRVRANALAGRPNSGRPASKPLRLIFGAWLEGHLTKPIRLGYPFRVACTCVNGKISICGRVYVSTEVTLIRGDHVFTQDDQFKVLRVPRFDPVKSLRAWK